MKELFNQRMTLFHAWPNDNQFITFFAIFFIASSEEQRDIMSLPVEFNEKPSYCKTLKYPSILQLQDPISDFRDRNSAMVTEIFAGNGEIESQEFSFNQSLILI
jgi:hypothetical protein